MYVDFYKYRRSWLITLRRRQILGLYSRSRKRRHRVHKPSTRRTHRQHILRTPTLPSSTTSILIHAQTDPCGLQLFHLLKQGQGGSTLLVDGFYVASLLKELHPKSYDILSRIGVPAHAAGEPGSLYTPTPKTAYPVLRHHNDALVQVRWNNDDRSVMDHLSASEMEEW